MAETSTKDRTAETYQRMEDSFFTVFENSRRMMNTMFEFQRTSITGSLDLIRNLQEESFRLTDAWLDQVGKFQKNSLKSFQDATSRWQDVTERTVRESQERLEDTVDQGLELVTPGGGGRSKRRSS